MDANLNVLNLVIVRKVGEGMFLVMFLDSLILLALIAWGPNELAEPANFLVPVKVMSTYVVRNALNKEGKKPETKASKIQHLVLHMSSNTNIYCSAETAN